MFDAANGFCNAPLPNGPSVAIITNAGGPGIITADACEGAGLEVRALSDETQRILRDGLVVDAGGRGLRRGPDFTVLDFFERQVARGQVGPHGFENLAAHDGLTLSARRCSVQSRRPFMQAPGEDPFRQVEPARPKRRRWGATIGLGLFTAFVTNGASTVIASPLPVPDGQASREIMVELHRRLASGMAPAQALAEAGDTLGNSVEEKLAKESFTCFSWG